MHLSIRLFALLLAIEVLPAQQYFPPHILGEDPRETEFTERRYSGNLDALQEPSLWELSRQDPSAEVYRFLWLRSLHHPIAVRLVLNKNGSGWMNSRMTSGQGGYEPGRITRFKVFPLGKTQTQAFLTECDRTNFWNLASVPNTKVAGPETIAGLDGAQWIVEGVRNGKYHMVDRWSPGTRDPVRALGILALKLGGFKIPARELY
jgi:hypothetical protein